MRVERYSSDKKFAWNDFLTNCKNRHFFFYRDFMEYHKDRFDDFSIMIYDKKDKLIALLPANYHDKTLYSHQGLTFGGFLVIDKMKLETMQEVIKAVKEFLLKEGFEKVIYKALPFVHQLKPFSEDIYLLRKDGAKVIREELSEVIDLKQSIKYSNGRKHSIRKAKEFGFSIEKSDDFKSFWDILESVLTSQHDSKPLHTLKEIEFLASHFPKNIELFLVKKDEKLYAGAVTFVNENIVKLQYVANYEEGRKLGALDLLIDKLIKEIYKDKRYFDFGTSLKSDGSINFGLIDQKERFGASGVLNDTYEWKLS